MLARQQAACEALLSDLALRQRQAFALCPGHPAQQHLLLYYRSGQDKPRNCIETQAEHEPRKLNNFLAFARITQVYSQ